MDVVLEVHGRDLEVTTLDPGPDHTIEADPGPTIESKNCFV